MKPRWSSLCLALFAALALIALPQPARADNLAGLVQVLKESTDSQLRLDVLRGISASLAATRNLPAPDGWTEAEAALVAGADPEVRALALSLGLKFGSPKAASLLHRTLLDASQPDATRLKALQSLAEVRDAGLPNIAGPLLESPALRLASIKILAAYEQTSSADEIIRRYAGLNQEEKRASLSTLASRASFAAKLMDAVEGGAVPRQDLGAEVLRQLRSLKSDGLAERISKTWGTVRDISADKQKEIERFRKVYWAGGSTPGDAPRGRVVFNKVCHQCHTLYGEGGKVGPDLTGSNRGDLDYLLQNMVDPNAVIPNDYRASTVTMKDDRVLTGIVKAQDGNSVTLVTPGEQLVLPRKEITSVIQSEISMMPEGLLQQLTEQEIRDLIYYLTRPGQVPLPAGS